MWEPSRAERVNHSVAALRALLEPGELSAIVLTTPGSVSWATGGMNPSIDRTAATDVIWVCVTPDTVAILTTEVEAPRIAADMTPDVYGIELIAVAWWDAQAMVRSALAVASRSAGLTGTVGSDGHPDFPIDLTDAVTAARMVLCDAEIAELRALGRDAAEALDSALATWTPGETDFRIQSRIVAALEAAGGEAPVVIVGADDRVLRFRHPAACGAPASNLVMAVVVARRSGLHVAATRYAHDGALPAELADGLETVRAIQKSVLAATRPGMVWGDALGALETAYAQAGHPGAWSQHYQGGPIGFAQREFEIAPSQRNSGWWDREIAAGTAVAWNPSIPGGAKDEDTYLIGAAGAELITRSNTTAFAAGELTARGEYQHS